MTKEEYCVIMNRIINMIKLRKSLSNNDIIAILETIKLDFMINCGMITIGDSFGARREK